MTKVCYKCKQEYPLEQFEPDLRRKHGKGSYCKPCVKAYKQSHYKKNKDKILKRTSKYSRTDYGKYIKIFQRIKETGISMDLSFEDYQEIIKDKTCFYCDFDFSTETGTNLNRIDNSKGYTKDNVKPCCKVCNFMMQDYSKEELIPRLYKMARRLKL